MTDIERYVKDKTMEELIRTQRTSVVGGEIHQAVTLEIQRIQQDTNNIQIAHLIEEVKQLKEITDITAQSSDQSAKGANKLAKVAIYVACASLIAQVLFSIHWESSCAYTAYGTNDPYIHFSGCYLTIDLGPFGKHSFNLPDYKKTSNPLK